MSTATPTPRLTAPLPQSAVDAIHRLEARLAGLRDGESVVIGDVTCTRVSLQVADLLERHKWASARCRRLSAVAVSPEDFEQLLDVQDVLSLCRCQLAAAGRLDLIESVEVRPARNADVERAVVRYEIAKAMFDRLTAMDARDMTGHQFTLMAESQDEMAERRTFLESVGQLHRIELA